MNADDTVARIIRTTLLDDALLQLAQAEAEVQAAVSGCADPSCTDSEPCDTCETLMFALDGPVKLCWLRLQSLGAKVPERFRKAEPALNLN